MAIEKDGGDLRDVFGQEGDCNQHLADLFGSAYLDHPDDTDEKIPAELQGLSSYNISGVVDRMIESTEPITCQRNQTLLRDYLIHGSITLEESFSTTIHSEACSDRICRALQRITVLDKYYNLSDLLEMARAENLL